MQGQPSPSAEPYAESAMAIARIAEWAIDRTGESPPSVMADFFQMMWSTHPGPVQDVLEICCGNGRILRVLAERGFSVTGLDKSSAMLGQARENLGPDVELIHAELPTLPVQRQFDAVVSAAAGLNYLTSESDLARTFTEISRILSSGSTFVFDLLSRRMLKEVFGSKNWAADLDDLAAMGRFESDADTNYCDYHFTQFVRIDPAGTYQAHREMHRLYTFDHEVIRRLAAEAGFGDADVYDNYTARSASSTTEYETWVLFRS